MTDPHNAGWESWLQKWFVRLLIPAILVNAGGLLIDILEPDGALYATIAKTIARSGDFINLYVDGKDWLDKPHFPFWMAALSFRFWASMALPINFRRCYSGASEPGIPGGWRCRLWQARSAIVDADLCIGRSPGHLQQRCPGRTLSHRPDHRFGLSFL
jgi:hypothetical protein